MGDGIFKQRNGLLAVNVAGACGVLTPGQFTGLGLLAQKMGAAALKLTSRQTVVAVLAEENVNEFVAGLADLELKLAPYGNTVRAVKACAGGVGLCPRSLAGVKGEALELGMEIQEKYLGQPVPKDFKIAVAGCPRGCTDPYCADFGVVSCGRDLFDIFIGGRGGSPKPLHGTPIARRVPREKVFAVLEHVLDKFRTLAQPGEKLSQCISRVGLESLLPPADLISEEKKPNQADEFASFLQAGK